jgi:hypothetical protein
MLVCERNFRIGRNLLLSALKRIGLLTNGETVLELFGVQHGKHSPKGVLSRAVSSDTGLTASLASPYFATSTHVSAPWIATKIAIVIMSGS